MSLFNEKRAWKSESAWLEACRTGDNAARKRLYTLYAEQLLAVCYRYTGEMESAHDVLHDGFIKVFTNFSYRGECPLFLWLRRVMVTQAIDYLRKEQRMKELPTEEMLFSATEEEADIAEEGEQIPQEKLMEFLAELPDGCRTVFNLYVFEEKSHREIAELLDIKVHTSSSQLHRAKSILAKRIKEYILYER